MRRPPSKFVSIPNAAKILQSGENDLVTYIFENKIDVFFPVYREESRQAAKWYVAPTHWYFVPHIGWDQIRNDSWLSDCDAPEFMCADGSRDILPVQQVARINFSICESDLIKLKAVFVNESDLKSSQIQKRLNLELKKKEQLEEALFLFSKEICRISAEGGQNSEFCKVVKSRVSINVDRVASVLADHLAAKETDSFSQETLSKMIKNAVSK